MHPGTQQDQRLPDALRPGYFLPDELSLAERIRLSVAQAEHLQFTNAMGAPTGTWAEVLLRDETIVLADLIAYPLERMLQSFLQALNWEGEANLWQQICALIHRYDTWCRTLLDAESPAARSVGEVMLGQLRKVLAEPISRAAQTFGWEQGALRAEWQVVVTTDVAKPDDTPARRQLLRRTCMGLCQVLAKLQELARLRLEPSLSTGRHDPAMGLLLAVLHLVQYSRAPLNRFPERFNDFYYGQLLGMRPRPPSTEWVYLLLERDSQYQDMVRIDAGARFIGGKDPTGKPIEFAAEQALDVSDTRVVALHSLRLERNRLISPEREFDYVTGVKVETIPPQAPEAAYLPRPAWWPLLGGLTKASAAKARDAKLGLAVVSSLLALREGSREIRLSLRFVHPSDDDESLRSLLRADPQTRTVAWLERVFQCYGAFERQYFPIRPRPGRTSIPPTAALLAQAAWARSAEFEADVQLSFLLSSCIATADPEHFAERLGRLFGAWLIAGQETFRPCDLAALRAHAAQLKGEAHADAVELDDPLILIYPGMARTHPDDADALPDRALIFDRVLAGAWQAQLSTATGWLTVDTVFTQRVGPRTDGNGWAGGAELALRVGAEQPAITACQPAIHGSDWPAQAALQLQAQTKTRMCTYSVLQQWILQDVTLDVSVSGLRDVVLYNQLGRLDPSKPFQPFGPIPSKNAYLVWGSAELASKPLQTLRMHVKWGGLPSLPGGFAEHYRGYPGNWALEQFRVRPQVLMDGQWQAGTEPALPLFRRHGVDRSADDDATLPFPSSDLRRWHRASGSARNGAFFQFGLNSRNGFFRFDLVEPANAFGHADYPKRLTEVLTHNARSKRPLPLPNEPYTPQIESLTIDYQACQKLSLGQLSDGTDGQIGGEGVFQLHPFGMQPIHTTLSARHPSLLPRYVSDGNLYIGIESSDPQGLLSLYFHLRKEEAAERWLELAPQLQWSAWCDSGWQPIKPFQHISDTTQGMLCSGIVQLSLPDDMSRNCPQLPGNAYWLRLSANWGFEQLAGLYGVHAQAVRAYRVNAATAEEKSTSLSPGTIRQPLKSVAGLRSVLQVGASFGRQPIDPADMLLTRSAERLRHKQRAVTIWDYERLLLDAFPEVYKVKCFAHQLPSVQIEGGLTLHGGELRPGHVLVVVVPAPHQGSLFSSTDAPKLDAATLERMTTYLHERGPVGVRLVVRNAAYERIQVRCSVRLMPGMHVGAAIRQLNQAIVEYLSPWHDVGYTANFGWEIDGDALEAHLRAEPYVAAVGRLSLLHIVCSDQRYYVLRDTARRPISAAERRQQDETRKVRPEQAWSLALPTRHHLIEITDDLAVPPQSTGLARLEVGSTFIVGSQRNRHLGRERHDQ